jgi:hypothetical protein
MDDKSYAAICKLVYLQGNAKKRAAISGAIRQ